MFYPHILKNIRSFIHKSQDADQLDDGRKDMSHINSILKKYEHAYLPKIKRDKFHFFHSLPAEGKLLDVGCGNDSPEYTKSILPSWYYIGLDVGDYNQHSKSKADKYIITDSSKFTDAILSFKNQIDAVVSSHNLEHCDDRCGTLNAIAQSLRSGGRLYISFPTHDSITFHKGRNGCLNYYDDNSHKDFPPNFGKVIQILTENGLVIDFATTNYQPPIEWFQGLINEEISARELKTKEGTWELWGFETIIWATRPPEPNL